MCGRFALRTSIKKVAKEFGIEEITILTTTANQGSVRRMASRPGMSTMQGRRREDYRIRPRLEVLIMQPH
jgi:hypothetical protein